MDLSKVGDPPPVPAQPARSRSYVRSLDARVDPAPPLYRAGRIAETSGMSIDRWVPVRPWRLSRYGACRGDGHGDAAIIHDSIITYVYTLQ